MDRPSSKTYFHLRMIFSSVGILFVIANIAEAVVVTGDRKGCGGIITGSSGNFSSPGYPNSYTENLICSWNITVDSKSRIQFNFLDFEIEAGIGCLYDYVLFRDGGTINDPVLGKICHANPQSILSTQSSVLVQFVSDMNIVKRGFLLQWQTVPKVPLLQPNGISVSSPWVAIPTPKNLARIDGGISESIWATDINNNVYIYSNNNWDLVDGRMTSVTAGESIFAISSYGDLWYRQGVLVENPRGYEWQQVRVNIPMMEIESGRRGVAVGLDFQGNLYQFGLKDTGPTGVYWKLTNSNPTDPFNDVSCGSYGCWVVTKSGDVFNAPGIDSDNRKIDPTSLLTKIAGIKMKQVAAGFGGSVWAISQSGDVYKRTGVNALSPGGSDWLKVDNVKFNMITFGLTKVYGLTANGVLVTLEEKKCGGIITEKKGQFSSPNYPNAYPRGITCLWLIRVPDAEGITFKVKKPTGIGKRPRCLDHLLTFVDSKYPSRYEPIIECGDHIGERYFNGNEVWIEFRSQGNEPGVGFLGTYEASFYQATTTSSVTTSTETLTAPSSNLHKVPSVRSTTPQARITALLSKSSSTELKPTASSTFGKSSLRLSNYQQSESFTHSAPAIQTFSSTKTLYAQSSETHTTSLKASNSINRTPVLSDVSKTGLDIAASTRSFSSSVSENLDTALSNGISVKQATAPTITPFYALSIQSTKSKITPFITNTLSLSKASALRNAHSSPQLISSQALTTVKTAVRSTLLPSTSILTRTPPMHQNKTEGKPLPSGWEIMKTPTKFIQVSTNAIGQIWALDTNGRPYVLIDESWRLITPEKFTSLAVSTSGVWGVTDKGQILFRQGVTGQNPQGVSWVNVGGSDVTKIIIGPNDIIVGMKRDGSLIWRAGITSKYPTGSNWLRLTRLNVVDASYGDFGLWVIDDSGKLMFKSNPRSENRFSRAWRVVPGKLKNIRAGHGGSLWGILVNGTLVKRSGVSSSQPFGTNWNVVDTFPVTDVSLGVFNVYRILSDGTLLRRSGNTCGGRFSSARGILKSPNYPSNYPKKLNCLWVIKVPDARKIEVKFKDFDLEPSQYCYKDQMITFSSESDEPVIECGRNVVTKLVQGNQISIELLSDDFEEGKGFVAEYKAYFEKDLATTTKAPDRKCGGLLTRSSGTFSSPNYPNPYPNDIVCLWVIKVPKAKQIRVIFDEFILAANGNDFLAYSENGIYPLFKKHLLVTEPIQKQYSIEGDAAFFEFVSDASNSTKGFLARYETGKQATTTKSPTTTAATTTPKGCGGSLYQNSGQITSPGYPFAYPPDSDCRWIITVEPGRKILLRFNDLSLENSHCGFDFVSVGDGPTVNENTWKKLCGDKSGQLFTSTSNVIWVRFSTDSADQFKGFKASWTSSKLFTSEKPTTLPPSTSLPTTVPNYLPEGWAYKSSPSRLFKQVETGITNYVWALGSNGRPYILSNDVWMPVTDRVFTHISVGDSGTWAVTDEGRILYRGGQSLLPQGSKWDPTGSSLFKMVDSGPRGFVTAITRNGELVYRNGISKQYPSGTSWKNMGKKLEYVSVGSYGIWGIDDDKNVHFARRPAQLTGSQLAWQRIPGLKLKEIDAGFGDSVWGIATDGRVYKRKGITHDRPEGSEWLNENANMMSVTTGLKGVFGVARNGRLIYKRDLSTHCGGIPIASSGQIKTPGFQLSYPNNVNCLWIIRVPSAKSIRLTVDSFELQPNCELDYMLLYRRGYYAPEAGVDRYCGKRDSLRRNVFDGGEVWVQYYAPEQRGQFVSSRGFSLSYKADLEDATIRPTIPVSTTLRTAPSTKLHTTASSQGCGGNFVTDYGSFSSPGFPTSYPNNLRCIWTITLKPDRVLSLSFDDFSVEDDINCRFDFLLVRTTDSNGLELGKFCGSIKPRDIRLNDNKVWLLFTSDSSVGKRGFRVVWSSEPRSGPVPTTIPKVTSPVVTITTGAVTKETTKPTQAARIPDGWTEVITDIDIAHVDGGISQNAWAVDKNGNTYIHDGQNWRLVLGKPMKWVTSGASGVWAIDKQGNPYFRVNIAPLAPMGAYWQQVDGSRLEKLDSGPEGVVIAVDSDNRLLLREGISSQNPIGTRWREIGRGFKHVSASSYGYWVIDLNNQAYFSSSSGLGPLSTRLRWTPVAGKFIQVKGGFGGSLWAVSPDHQLYVREGITAITPTGLRWRKIDNLNVNGVTTGMSGVFTSVRGTRQVISTPDRTCGDIFTDRTGTFSSPSYPNSYPPNTVCLWQIKVPNAKRIIVEFPTFNLGTDSAPSTSSCNEDYLLYLTDGRFPSAYAARKKCGRDSSPITFEGDKAWIEFVADDRNNYPGFTAKYRAVFHSPPTTNRPVETTKLITSRKTNPTTKTDQNRGCGRVINAYGDTKSYLTHPGYPKGYTSNLNCQYLIRTEPGQRIKLIFYFLDIVNSANCARDYIRIYDGNSRDGKLLGKICGSTKPAEMVSTGRFVYIEFRTGPTSVGRGFVINYITEKSEAVTTARPTETTTKKFVPEGPKISEIRRRCGSVIDATEKHSGFIAHPSYPDKYKNSIDCRYIIQTSPGSLITLSFEKFVLEAPCNYDSIEVRDGSDQQAKSLGKFCGTEIPKDITSTGNALFIQFRTDVTTTFAGFLAKWKVHVDNTLPTAGPKPGVTTKDPNQPITECGRVLSSDNGIIANPGYPGKYPSNVNCYWSITLDPSKQIQLTFEVFDIEPSATCSRDYIEIFEGSLYGRSIGKYCNKMPEEIVSSSNRLTISFHSNNDNNYRGFVARWKAQTQRPTTRATTTRACFQRVSGVGGQIHRGGLSSLYQPNTDCVWIITVSPNKKIKISFDFLDLEESPSCRKDSLKLLDGPNDVSRTLGNFCGRKQIPDMTSSGNEIFIRFRTDATNNRRGFQLQWTAIDAMTTRTPTTAPIYGVDICGGLITGTAGYITSPNYPSDYPKDLSCRKIIRSPLGTRIVITFLDLNLEDTSKCESDVLFISDGTIPTAPSLGRYCGSSLPSQIKSSGNSIFMEFVSDYSVVARGFRLSWATEKIVYTTPKPGTKKRTTPAVFPKAPTCGGRLFGNSGYLQNPTFNQRYPYGITCIWTVEVGPTSSIDVKMISSNFDRNDCTKSYLLLRDGMGDNGQEIVKYCGSGGNPPFSITGNALFIEYRIGENEYARDFKLRWTENTREPSKALNCGGILTESNGYITSPLYPTPYGNNLLCTWTIVSPIGYKIIIDFESFDLEADSSCSKDYLSIRNGDSSDSALIGQFCGRTIPRSITSTKNSLRLQFKTDCKTARSGFLLKWRRDNSSPVEPTPQPTTAIRETAIKRIETTTTIRPRTKVPHPTIAEGSVNSRGGLITGINGVIRSPNHPSNYPNNQDIVWVLKGPAPGRIAITFRAFDLEDDSGCRYDFLQLRDGPAADSPLTGRFCGRHMPATYTSANNALWVKFHSDGSDVGTGFEAAWEWIQSNELPALIPDSIQALTECGGELSGNEGSFSSPNHPKRYPPKADCVWTIRGAPSSQISLHFSSFNIEPESRCGYDFVEVRRGDSSQSPLIGRFCGLTAPDAEIANVGPLWIRFSSDASSNYRGFFATWKTSSSRHNQRRNKRNVIENRDKKVCGGALSGSNGTLTINKEFGIADSSMPFVCKWTIKSPDRSLITLHVKDLGFSKLQSCDTSFMDINVYQHDSLQRLARLCPSDTSNWSDALMIPTRSNRIVVEYSLNRRLDDKHFQVVWTSRKTKVNSPTGFPLFGTNTGCGERLFRETGVIKSPRYPNNYGINTACVWIISTPDVHSHIELKFGSFSLEGHSHCRYDYLLIKDGDSQASPTIGKYCGNKVPDVIRSSKNKLWLKFYSDSVFTRKGFIATYTQAKSLNHEVQNDEKSSSPTVPAICGGQLSGHSGQIISPGYPSTYPGKADCVWHINNNNPTSIIEISFDDFKLENTPRCLYDYVLIEDISEREPRLLGKYCGGSIPPSTMAGQKLRVTFRSDDSISDIGFKINWIKRNRYNNARSVKRPACGGRETGIVGFLKSTNYPENYGNEELCEWEINAPESSMKIQLRFAEFDLEPSSSCEYDYIKIHDGKDRNSPVLGQFCGRDVPDMIESTGRSLFVIFHTDKTDTRSGFEITWVAVFKEEDPNGRAVDRKARVPETSSVSCGGIFHSSTGVIETPNHPKAYPPNTVCTWRIEVNKKSTIKLTFQSFDLEKHSSCKYDSLVIRDGSTDTSKTVRKLCGDQLPAQILSTDSALWIQFKADDSKQLNGFKASWELVDKSSLPGCGSKLTSNSGEISSPNYPTGTTDRKYCTWLISIPQASKIILTFKDIHMLTTSSCSNGYVQVFDGDSMLYPELGRFCHPYLPRPITSSSNKLLIGFQPDGSLEHRGFKAEWRSIVIKPTTRPVISLPPTPCGSTIVKESGNLVLPKGISSCTWLLRPASGKRITLSVVKANLIPNPKCNVEKIEIRNGFTSAAPLLLRICGRLQPKSVKSFTGALRINYFLYGATSNQDINLFWTTASDSTANDFDSQGSCGIIRVPLPTNIINGRALATSGQFPWMAGLLGGSGIVHCGAALLSSKWAITAAHCFKRLSLFAFRKVMVGELNLQEREGTEQELKIKLIYIHPNYNPNTNENDIALINLEGEVTLNEKVNTICLPDNNTSFTPGTVCSTAGWGTRRFLGKPSKPLVLARIPLVSTHVCNSTSAYNGNIKGRMICAGRPTGGLDTCQGDGGGPLTCEVRPGKHVIIGISSWGNGCAAPNKFGVYTDVRQYLRWIKTIIEF